MRNYEIMFIVKSTLSEEDIQKVADNFKNVLESNGSTVTSVDAWGQKALAYDIKKDQKYINLDTIMFIKLKLLMIKVLKNLIV